MNPNLTKKNYFAVGGGGGGWRLGGVGGGRGARVIEFFHKQSKSKKTWGGWGWGQREGGRGRGRWKDRRTGPNQLSPSTSSKLGA